MDGLLCCIESSVEPFREFGVSAFAEHRRPLSWLDLNQPRRAVRQEIRHVCPTTSGVYGMIDCDQQLIYVGTSRSLRQRLLTYFYQGTSGAREKRIASHARTVVWEPAEHEFTAQLRELELIRRWRPRFNRRGQPGRSRRGFVCLTRTEAPRFSVSLLPPRACHQSWGPIAAGRRTRSAVRTVNHVFQLADCGRRVPIRFPDQRQLFPQDPSPGCLRGMLNTCLAPCAGRCTRSEYVDRVQAACDFLDGRGAPALVDRFEAEMLEAAERQEFERAATLRDRWEDLTYLYDQIQRRRDATARRSCVYPVCCPAGNTTWYLVVRGQIVRAVTAPQDADSAGYCLHALEEAFSAGVATALDATEDAQQTQLVAAWFRRHPEELDRTMLPERAVQLCRQILPSGPSCGTRAQVPRAA
jgi:excinuclease ABC subunit C